MDAIELEGIKNQLHNGTLHPPKERAKDDEQYRNYSLSVSLKLSYFFDHHLAVKTRREFREGDNRGIFIIQLLNRLDTGIDYGTYKTASIPFNIADTYQEKTKLDTTFDKSVKKEFAQRWNKEDMPKRTEQAINDKIKDILTEHFNENRSAILQEAQAELDEHFKSKLAEIAQLRRALQQNNVDAATVQRAKEVAQLRTNYLLQKEQNTLRKKLSKE